MNYESTEVEHDFVEDGWKILRIDTPGDMTALGGATKNCIGASWATKSFPAPTDELEAAKSRFRAQWDTPTNRKRYGDEWVEEKCAGYERCPLPKRTYRLMAMLDDEGRTMAAIMLGIKEGYRERAYTYAGYDDLGQVGGMVLTVDGVEFVLLQATMGTAWMSEEVAEHCAQWFQGRAIGDWDEAGYQKSLEKYRNYGRTYA